MEIRCEETKYGFNYGAAKITRLFSHKDGSVTLSLATPKGDLQIYVTRTGKVRIFDYYSHNTTAFGREWQGTLTKRPCSRIRTLNSDTLAAGEQSIELKNGER